MGTGCGKIYSEDGPGFGVNNRGGGDRIIGPREMGWGMDRGSVVQEWLWKGTTSRE